MYSKPSIAIILVGFLFVCLFFGVKPAQGLDLSRVDFEHLSTIDLLVTQDKIS